jgi:hypothetical protein
MSAPGSNSLVRSYLFLRRAIGIIGLALPAVLIVGELVVGDGHLRNSISSYYHSDLRNIFVGSLVAIGVFLLSYRGYGPIDEITGDVGAVAAIGAALFPVAPANATRTERIVGMLHGVFGAVFFLTLAFFCLFLFTRTGKARPTPQKLQRNQVYRASGIVIVASLILIVVFGWLLDRQFGALHPVLWLETVAILAFGLAWLTKGAMIMRDVSPAPVQPRRFLARLWPDLR